MSKIIAGASALTLAVGLVAATSAQAAVPAAPAAPARVDLKVLVLDAGDVSTNALVAEMDREGVPYTRLVGSGAWTAVNTAGYLSATLNTGTPQATLEGKFQGIIVPDGNTAGLSAVTATLASYEKTFGVREVTATASFGNPYGLPAPLNATCAPLVGSAAVQPAAIAAGFNYIKADPITHAGSFAFDTGSCGFVESTAPAAGPANTVWAPFVTTTIGASTGALIGVLTDNTTAGQPREQMIIGGAYNLDQQWAHVIGRGVVSWLTRGVYLGYARNYFSLQADDMFLGDERWDVANQCTPMPGAPAPCPQVALPDIRMNTTVPTGYLSDVDRLLNWQNLNGFKIDFPFNASGATADSLLTDMMANKTSFGWINHTWDHEFLGCVQSANSSTGNWTCTTAGAPPVIQWVSSAKIQQEINDNKTWAATNLVGTTFNGSELVTGEHSGLILNPQQPTDNPNLAPALAASGVTTIASDNSRESAQRAVGAALTVPRYPMNIFYNAATFQEEVGEYNWIYTASTPPTPQPAGWMPGSGLCGNGPNCLPYLANTDDTVANSSFTSGIMPLETTIALRHVLTNDPRPHYAHQSNLAEDAILLPVLTTILNTYKGIYDNATTPIVQTSLTQQKAVLQTQATWGADRTALAATPYLDADGVHIPAAGPHGTIPLTVPAGTTGAAVTGFQAYDGSSSSYGGSVSGWTNATSATVAVTGPLNVGYRLAPSAPNLAPTGAPNNVSGQVTLSFPVPNPGTTALPGSSPVTGYDITPYVAGAAQNLPVVPVASTTVVAGVATTLLTGLVNGTSYTFTVAGVNAAGTGPASAQSLAITPRTVPGAPTAVTGVAGTLQVAVSWAAPAVTGGSPITGYTVTPYDGATALTPIVLVGTATTTNVTGLTAAKPYTFTVAATNAAGTGAPSAASAAITPYTVPDPPTTVAGQPGDTAVGLTWSAPAFDGASPITGYTVTPYDGSTALTPIVLAGTTTNTTVAGLTNGTPYTFTVAATNAAGTGTASAHSAAVTPHTVPGTPTGVTVTLVGDTQVGLSWTAPLSNGGFPLTSYRIKAYVGATLVSTTNTPDTSTSYSLTGLTNGVAYTFTVAATNAADTGLSSVATTAVTPFGRAAAPTGLVATRGNTTANLGWTAPADNGNGRAITGYVVTVTPAGGSAYAVAEPNSTNVTINGLTNGTSYTFTVHAVTTDVATGDHAGFESVASNAVTPSGVPIVAIKALPATIAPVTTAAKVTYSWTGTPKGSPIAKYDLYVRRAAFGKVLPGAWSLLKAGLRTTAYAVAINPGETLVISVRATDAASTLSGFAPASQVVTSVLPTSKLTRSKSGWAKVGASTTYQSKTLGAAAQTASVSGIRRIVIVAATGVGYGSVTVWIGKTKIKALSLATTKAKAKASSVFVVVLTAKQTSTLRGAVIVTVATKGKLVRLGGLGVLR